MDKVHIVFQGGGAKLATLLAAAEACALADGDKFRITRVTGTSAGAIIAVLLAMYSTPDKFEAARERLVRAAIPAIDQFLPRFIKLKIVLRLLAGRPVFDEETLRRVLRETLKVDDSSSLRMVDIPTPIEIIAADIRTGQRVIYDNRSDRTVIDAVCDSCALPFAFRNHRSGTIVDGGLFANLNFSRSLDDSESVIAFGFDLSDKPQPQSSLQYLAALMFSAIENSVREARARVMNHGGFVIDLPSDFSTYQFREALVEGMALAKYRRQVEWSALKITEAIGAFKRPYKPTVDEQYKLNFNVFSRITKEYPWRLKSTAILVLANGLFQSADPRSKLPDEVEQRSEIAALDDGRGLIAFQIAIGASRNLELGRLDDFLVRDRFGVRIPVVGCIGLHQTATEKNYYALFYPDEVVAASRCPVSISHRLEHIGSLSGLADGQTEWICSRASPKAGVDARRTVIGLPAAFRPVQLMDIVGNEEFYSDEFRKNVDAEALAAGKVTPGRPMTEQQLNDYFGDDLPPKQFRFFGWIAEHIQPNHLSGVLIR